MVRIRDLHTLYFGETKAEDIVAVEGDVRCQVAEALRRSGYVEGPDIEDDALSAYMKEQRRGDRSGPKAATTVPFCSGGERPLGE